MNIFTSIYYHIKPLIPRNFQILIRRKCLARKRMKNFDIWPIDEKASKPPDGWTRWPEKKQFAVVLTHDIETGKGQAKCHKLIKLEEELGFRSAYNFVAERYRVYPELQLYLRKNGFEVGVHGLYHDGKLYRSKKVFQERARKINYYLKKWESVGFRSPSMHNNLEWIHDLNIEYDSSTFDTDPFEPQSKGVGTIFPFLVSKNPSRGSYIELPYTLPQDSTLFIFLGENNINTWKRKLDWVAINGGMVLLTTHPDYMNFDNHRTNMDEYPVKYYAALLNYIKTNYKGKYWHVLPRDMARFWSSHSSTKKNT